MPPTRDSLTAALLGLSVEQPGGRRKVHYTIEDFQPRTLNSFAIVYIYGGRGLFESAATERLAIETGDVFFLFPGVEHRYGQRPGETWDELWMLFEGFIPEHYRAAGLLDPERPVFRLGNDREVLRVWRDAVRAGEEARPGHERRMASALFTILGSVFKAARPRDPESEAAQRLVDDIIALMETRLAEPEFPLEALASRFSRSYSWLRQRFREIVGCSPARYFARLKMRMAKTRLLTTADPIKAIALDLGFEDPYHFSRRFKTIEGMAPEHFRESFGTSFFA